MRPRKRVDESETTAIWVERIWNPYSSGKASNLLALDDYKFQKQGLFVEAIHEIKYRIDIILSGRTSVLQPC